MSKPQKTEPHPLSAYATQQGDAACFGRFGDRDEALDIWAGMRSLQRMTIRSARTTILNLSPAIGIEPLP
jgi:hypothetical protein